MRNKRILLISILLFIVVLSIGAASAQDADVGIVSYGNNTVVSNSESVSGGVDVVTENPMNGSPGTSGELSYSIPSDAKSIKSADVYVNVYSGSAQNTYGANANITITTSNNDTKHTEMLWIEEGSTDGTVYVVNDYITKCYSDFMIHYDITDMLNGLNGTNLKINVDTFAMDGKQFDGRIKLIALILAYDDGDNDSISYFINDDQLWSKKNVTVTFDTESISNFTEATLTNVVLSSGDGTYILNEDDYLGDADVHVSGNYYQYNQWDVTGTVKANQNNDLHVLYAGTGSYGSIKNVLSVLTIANIVPLETQISLVTEYTSVPSAYAGTNNTLTVNVQTTKAGDYGVKLLADGVEVDNANVALVEGSNTILLTDPTIRAVDASTVNGAENNIVNYAVELSYKGDVVDSNNISLPVLYNGNLGTDYEFNVSGFEETDPITVNGDFVIDVKDVSSYLGSAAMNRTDVWAITLDSNSQITNAFVYVPYNWFNAKTYTEDVNMFNAMFNNVAVTPVALYRDQGNLGNYGKYGYGVLIYDVTGLIAVGDNSFVLNKVNPTPAVYPSVLVYMYNTTGSEILKTVYTLNGADLLANSYNNAGRIVKADTEMAVDATGIDNATLYVLAASAQVGESDIVFNGETYSNVWSGTSSTTDLFTTDVTGLIDDTNSISFVATGSTILELPQFIVTSKNVGPLTEISLGTEYTSVPSAYAGTNNTLTVKVKTTRAGNYDIKLLADGVEVNATEVALIKGENTILITDPTIRPIDASTVNGAENNVVVYTVDLSYNDTEINTKDITLPVLYNGNLGYDMEYDVIGFEEATPITINGDFVIDVKDVSSYLGSSAMNRTDVWAITLDSNSQITNAYIYVPYNWFNAKTYTEDINMFNAMFNNVAVTPVALYRDQGNLGNYGKYGYGVLIYDVTGLIAVGDNSFVLNKVNPTPAVYPSALVYMYNTTGSEILKTVYTLNGADLLANSYNNAGRIVKADTEMVVDATGIDNATLYVLAASAQTGESDIVFNGETYSNVWSGTSSTTDLFTTDVTGLIDDTNAISFVATGSTILELPQFIVTSVDNRQSTTLSASKVTTVYGSDAEFVATLKDASGKRLSDAEVNLVLLKGDVVAVNTTLVTDANGQIRFAVGDLDPAVYYATVSYAGNSTYNSAVKEHVKVYVQKVNTALTAADVTAIVNDGGELVATLTDVNGNAIADAKVTMTIDGAKQTVRTDADGQAVFSTDGLDIGEYTTEIAYKASTYYYASSATANVVITDRINTTLSASKVITVYGSDAEFVATLKDASGKRLADTEVNLVLLKGDVVAVNTTLVTDANGQIRFAVGDLDPAVYYATVSYAGNSTYNSAVKEHVKVYVQKVNTALTAADVTAIVNDGGELVATLTDVNGNAIADAKVTMTIDGAKQTVRTDADGQAVFSTDGLDIGEYTAEIAYKASTYYYASSATANVVITDRINTTLSASKVITVYGSDAEFVATLKDASGKRLADAEVNLVLLKGDVVAVNTTLVTDANGQIRFAVGDLDPAVYYATVSYAGNSTYNSAVKEHVKVYVQKVNTVLTAPDITTTYGSGDEVVATLTDVNGNAIADAKVTMTIDGAKQTVRTDADGQAVFSTDGLAPGSYTAEFAYKASTYYYASSTTANVTITE